MFADCELFWPEPDTAVVARFRQVTDNATVLWIDPGPGQPIMETIYNPALGPAVEDLNRDGRDELVVPVLLGNVNTRKVVWALADDGSVVRAGEVAGIEVTYTESGYIAVENRGAANQTAVSFMVLRDGRLIPIVSAEVEAFSDDGETVSHTECTLTDDGGLAETGLSLDAAQQAFCDEPIVASLYGGR